MLIAFCATVCLQPATLNPVSSKFDMVLDFALAAFHRVEPHIWSVCYVDTYYRNTQIHIYL